MKSSIPIRAVFLTILLIMLLMPTQAQEAQAHRMNLNYTPNNNGFVISGLTFLYKFIDCDGIVLSVDYSRGSPTSNEYIHKGKRFSKSEIGNDYFTKIKISGLNISAKLYHGNIYLGDVVMTNIIGFSLGCYGDTYNVLKQVGKNHDDYKDSANELSLTNIHITNLNSMSYEINDIVTDLQKQRKYNGLKREADALFENRNYSNALTKYAEALRVIPGDKYAKDKINESQRKIEEVNLEKFKQNDVETYKNLFIKADSQRDAERYNEAILTLNEILSLKYLEESYKDDVRSEIRSTQEMIANYNEEESQQQEDNEKGNKYSELIQKANQARSAGDLEKASEYLYEAYKINPSEGLLNNISSVSKEKINKEERTKATADRQTSYASTMAKQKVMEQQIQFQQAAYRSEISSAYARKSDSFKKSVESISRLSSSNPKELLRDYKSKKDELEALYRKQRRYTEDATANYYMSMYNSSRSDLQRSMTNIVYLTQSNNATKSVYSEYESAQWRLENSLEDKMENILNVLVSENTLNKLNSIRRGSVSISDKGEDYYISMAGYYQCIIDRLKDEFDQYNSGWVNAADRCRRPSLIANISYKITNPVELYKIAKRKIDKASDNPEIYSDFMISAEKLLEEAISYNKEESEYYYTLAEITVLPDKKKMCYTRILEIIDADQHKLESSGMDDDDYLLEGVKLESQKTNVNDELNWLFCCDNVSVESMEYYIGSSDRFINPHNHVDEAKELITILKNIKDVYISGKNVNAKRNKTISDEAVLLLSSNMSIMQNPSDLVYDFMQKYYMDTFSYLGKKYKRKPGYNYREFIQIADQIQKNANSTFSNDYSFQEEINNSYFLSYSDVYWGQRNRSDLSNLFKWTSFGTGVLLITIAAIRDASYYPNHVTPEEYTKKTINIAIAGGVVFVAGTGLGMIGDGRYWASTTLKKKYYDIKKYYGSFSLQLSPVFGYNPHFKTAEVGLSVTF